MNIIATSNLSSMSEYFTAEDELNIEKCISQIESCLHVSSKDTDVCLRFWGLDEAWFWVRGMDVVECGGIEAWLESMLDMVAAEYICNNDWEICDTDGLFAGHFYQNYGGFDWTGYQEAKEYIEDRDHYADEDIVLAALELGIPLESIEDAYCGSWYSDREFVEEYCGECMEIPSHLEYYIDWDAVTRDYIHDFNSFNGHYFHSNW